MRPRSPAISAGPPPNACRSPLTVDRSAGRGGARFRAPLREAPVHRGFRASLNCSMVARMPTLIQGPTQVTAAGNKPKIIEEFVGRVNNGESRLSVARMRSPSGWQEPGQRPEFDEYTVV